MGVKQVLEMGMFSHFQFQKGDVLVQSSLILEPLHPGDLFCCLFVLPPLEGASRMIFCSLQNNDSIEYMLFL